MSDIHLNFINQSNDQNNSQIVIFQKNIATGLDELHVAWTVIKNCSPGWHHPFVFPFSSAVGSADSYGNQSPLLQAENGIQFQVEDTAAGHTLAPNGTASDPNSIEVLNALETGAINAGIYKDGRLFAQKTGIAPGQKAAFMFKPTIWIGVVSQVEEGEVMNSAIVSNINTELSLLGIASADIIMTGGGPGSTSQPFQFTLSNIQYI
ncbi:hypothetical protein ACTHGU_09545 [Chitinophagaceae bacterium MMS25-I14]